MQSNPAFAEETKIVLSSINSPSILLTEDESLENPDDAFELLLPIVLNKETLNVLEDNLGLGGGGDWWIDPSRDPIEVDSNGNRDEGAISDVEANCRIWYRTPFDRDPEFCNNSYHLLNRLNELARIKGLIEEASLRKKSRDEKRINDNEHQIYHSTLSVNASMDLNNVLPQHANRDVQNIDPLIDLRRSLNGSFEECFNPHGTYALRKQNQKVPLREVFNTRAQEFDSTRYSEKPKPPFSQAVYSGLPQLHKSQRPSSPHSIPVNMSPNLGNRKMSTKPNGLLLVPGATSSPDQSGSCQKRSVLSRTYSKEQMDLLKEVNDNSLNESMPKVASLLSRSHALTTSLPMSDNEGDVDVTKSLDISSGVNQLSQSLSATELVAKSRKLSEKFNTSYSSMRSSDVFELARLQETHLREHSGSRSKLDCSNNSLTESSLGDEKHRKPKGSVTGSIGPKSSSGLSSCEISATHSREEIMIEDSNSKPERQHTITSKECFNPLSSSLDCEPKVSIFSNLESNTNLEQTDIVTPKPLNSTYDAPDFKRVYDCDLPSSPADGLRNYKPVIDTVDGTVNISNEYTRQRRNSVTHASHPYDRMIETCENMPQPNAFELNGCITSSENKSDTISPSNNGEESTKLGPDTIIKSKLDLVPSIVPPLDADPNDKNLQNCQATCIIPKPINDNRTTQYKQSGLKPPSKISIPLPNGSISRLPMLSHKMPSMSVSSRVGSRKSSANVTEQASTFVRSVNKTQSISQRNNLSSNNNIHSSGNSVSSNSIKASQPSNSMKSLPKSSSSVQHIQRTVPSRISLPSATSGTTTNTSRKPSVQSFGSSREKSSSRP
ncbi:cell wall Awa1p [Schistosoma japonicum]|uniref:Cell wall Awa1p n=1 Tax=Schistosoma japonicum TaxID=6182 RepID=A0A4Z2DH50_SCHJA|nr:cell wall Awa1p [Schistosoma japonicum]